MRYAIAGAAAVVIVAGSLVVACGSTAPKPSVTACKAAYPAWFAASEAAGRTTATPDGCKGLTENQVAEIAVQYLQTGGGK